MLLIKSYIVMSIIENVFLVVMRSLGDVRKKNAYRI
jgi:hypothetical protein